MSKHELSFVGSPKAEREEILWQGHRAWRSITKEIGAIGAILAILKGIGLFSIGLDAGLLMAASVIIPLIVLLYTIKPILNTGSLNIY